MPIIGGVYRPDFQADQSLPQWQQMGNDDQSQQAGQVTGSFVDMLKKRMGGNQRTPLDVNAVPQAPAQAADHEAFHVLSPDMAGKMSGAGLMGGMGGGAGKGAGGGGMKSL